MKKSLIVLGCAVFTIGLAGCGANNNAVNDDNNGQQQVQISQVNQGPATEGRTLRVANIAEQQVEQLEEVDNAHVIISDNNAYVAVKLADNRNNNVARTDNNPDENGNVIVNDALDGNGRTFAENGRVKQDPNRDGNDGIIDGNGDAGNRNRLNADNRVRVNNADDSGITENYYSQATNIFEQQITDIVRKTDSRINKVFISVDNNVYNKMGRYADDITTDRNRENLFEDFTNNVNNIFRR
jgi:hypothetical protein